MANNKPGDQMMEEDRMSVAEKKQSYWPRGPWTDEPDREEFRHGGLACLLNRNSLGVWCGYVAVPPGHPLHGADFDSDKTRDLEVHGGLTYAHGCQGEICHVPAPGEPDNVWWFGFDCAHFRDMSPSMEALRARPDWPRFPEVFGGLASHDVYRTIDYARAETQRLAEQLAGVI